MSFSTRQKQVALVAVVLIGGVWATTALLMGSLSAQRPTAQKVIEYVEQNPLQGLPTDDRGAFVEGLANRVKRLDMAQRQQLHARQTLRPVFERMTEDEQTRYIELTAAEGFGEFMDAMNELEPARREEVVTDALEEFDREARKQSRGQTRPALTEAQREKLLNEGLKSYYRDATAETKIALQPLIERMQQHLRTGR